MANEAIIAGTPRPQSTPTASKYEYARIYTYIQTHTYIWLVGLSCEQRIYISGVEREKRERERERERVVGEAISPEDRTTSGRAATNGLRKHWIL